MCMYKEKGEIGMYNVKQYKELMNYIKEERKQNRKNNRWEFALFLAVLVREKISCIEAMQFLFDYSQEVAPAEKKSNPKYLAERFEKLGSYGRVAKEVGLSYNTVKQKIESYHEVEGFVNQGVNSDLVERINKRIKDNDLNIEEILYPEKLKGEMGEYFEKEIGILELLENSIIQTIERNRSLLYRRNLNVWEDDTELEEVWEEEPEQYESKEDDTEWEEIWEEEEL